jgi:hypothetical protein
LYSIWRGWRDEPQTALYQHVNEAGYTRVLWMVHSICQVRRMRYRGRSNDTPAYPVTGSRTASIHETFDTTCFPPHHSTARNDSPPAGTIAVTNTISAIATPRLHPSPQPRPSGVAPDPDDTQKSSVETAPPAMKRRPPPSPGDEAQEPPRRSRWVSESMHTIASQDDDGFAH